MRILARNNPISAELAKQGRASTVASLVGAGAQAVYGDLKDRASLDAAVAGIDTVITATTTQRGGDDTLATVDLQGTLDLIDAARAAGVRRFIYTSAIGALQGHPVPLFDIKSTCEAALARSGLMGAQLPVNYLPPGSPVPLLPARASDLLNAIETFETFVDMHETAPAYGVRLTVLDEFLPRMLAH